MDQHYEEQAQVQGYTCICGIDEAGRGPLAGPVCAAAVILPPGCRIPNLNDSKKLSESQRETLVPLIQQQALSFCAAFASETEIDAVNILQATFLAMRRAVKGLSIHPDFALVDGSLDPKLGISAMPIVKGDSLCMSIAAASVLAKVARDHLMLKLDKQYSGYGFAQHKGYGTKLHYEKLREHGISPVHRRSFLKKFIAQEGFPDE